MEKLTKAQARKLVREHWAGFIWHADVPGGPQWDGLAGKMFCEESRKISERINRIGRTALAKEQRAAALGDLAAMDADEIFGPINEERRRPR